MKEQGDTSLPNTKSVIDGGASRFLNKGTNGRWRDVVSEAGLARYDVLVRTHFAPDLAHWVEHGRLASPGMRM